MKRKGYISFLFPKLIASLLAAVVLLGILQVTLDRNYYSALYSGLNSRRERYESIVIYIGFIRIQYENTDFTITEHSVV